MALDVTNTLRQFDSADPVKYDFAFSRLGILGICASGNHKCKECPLYPFCINDSMNRKDAEVKRSAELRFQS
jgi:hypothetical protein